MAERRKKMFRWIVDLFLDRYNCGGFDTARLHVTSQADTAAEAIADAGFRAQAVNPSWNVHTLGASSPDTSPYPEGWHDSGMA